MDDLCGPSSTRTRFAGGSPEARSCRRLPSTRSDETNEILISAASAGRSPPSTVSASSRVRSCSHLTSQRPSPIKGLWSYRSAYMTLLAREHSRALMATRLTGCSSLRLWRITLHSFRLRGASTRTACVAVGAGMVMARQPAGTCRGLDDCRRLGDGQRRPTVGALVRSWQARFKPGRSGWRGRGSPRCARSARR